MKWRGFWGEKFDERPQLIACLIDKLAWIYCCMTENRSIHDDEGNDARYYF